MAIYNYIIILLFAGGQGPGALHHIIMQNEVLLSDADLLAKVTTVAVKEQLLT